MVRKVLNYIQGTVLNIAHRGARAFAPENTLPAFAKAHMFGCQMIELDVHLSKDSEIIVHHDDRLTRCTDAADRFPDRDYYFISDFSAEEIGTLDAGSWFTRELTLPAGKRQGYLQSLTADEIGRHISPEEFSDYASGAVRVPTLRQVLELAGNLGLKVNIELKLLPRRYLSLTHAVLGLVKEMRMEEGVLISSFDHEQLLEVRRCSPAIATAVLTNERLALPVDYLMRIDADALHPGTDTVGLASITQTPDAALIGAVRRADKGINVWTCNDQTQMRQLIEAGVTGLISDYPNRVGEVLAELSVIG